MTIAMPKINDQALSLEDRIFQRLQELQDSSPDGEPTGRDTQLEADIYTFLYQELRRVVPDLPGMNWKANQTNADYSTRFTAVLNSAFVTILDRCPDTLMRLTTRSQLTGFVSRTMSRIMLNYYKRKGTGQAIIRKLGDSAGLDDAATDDVISRLADEPATYFERKTGRSFGPGLEVIAAWEDSSDPTVRQRGQAARLRFVDRLSYAEIAVELSTSRIALTKSEVENLIEKAKYHFRAMKS